MPTTAPEDTSYLSEDLALTTEDAGQSFLRTPLLGDGNASTGRVVRQRGTTTAGVSFSPSRDLEQQPQPLAATSRTPSRGGRARRRILDRSGNFRQSRGRWGVDRQNSRGGEEVRRLWCSCCCCFRSMYQEWGKDWFFWLAYQKTYVLFMLLFLSYGSIIVFFGFIYLAMSVFGSKAEVNPDGSINTIAFCDMDINNHMEAMYFSLSTMTTIGYGVSDYYFGGCYTPFLVVLWQVCTAVVFDAVSVGLIFHRISRGAKRSWSILFSDKAIIRRIRGVPYLMFRLGERRKYNLIDATVRCYCVRHERIPLSHVSSRTTTASEGRSNSRVRVETTYFISRYMRLGQPDTPFGSQVWMGLPQVMVHRIDQDSPLLPPPLWYDAEGMPHKYPPSYPTYDKSSASSVASSDVLEDPLLAAVHSSEADFGAIRDFLNDRDAELVILVEGTDEGTGQHVQARHSYKTCDIAWNHTFADCVYPYNRRQRRGPSSLDPVVTADFSKFHDLLPAPLDCDACAYVPDAAF
ncbi:K+ channel inward rectifier domain containing protein [Nitzschia inconspicua]|uniref:K+ channel inward rectifier domain containing protein n=1 Tax=Nitzschia inconspicua TaxID=303405 RepID=A0A9K3PPD1_9STRA|nr:K+ channel inward rectifier domain containing protein [Nitzschia inconspicua]